MSLTDTISTASSFAARTGQEIRGNQEMVGIGAANLAAGLFQGFPVSTSGSRTAVAERSGGSKTQLTGLTGAVLILVMIVLLPGLFRDLPQPALAAIVITASLSLADIPGTVRLWHQRKTEFWLSIAAFLGVAILGVAILGVLPGIAVAVVLSILNIFRRAWWPYQTVLGRVPGLEGFHDVTVHPNARHLVGLEIYRFDAPLFFANVKTFRDNVRRWPARIRNPPVDPRRRRTDHRCRHDGGGRVVRARPRTGRPGTSLVFAELKTPVRTKIDRYGLAEAIEPAHFFGTVEEAVAAYIEHTGVNWTTES